MIEHGFYLRILASRNPSLAEAAFRKGLERLRAIPDRELADVLTLASFLFNLQGVSVGGRAISHFAAPSIRQVPPDLIRGFLTYAREVFIEQAARMQNQRPASFDEDTAETKRPQTVYLALEQMLPIFETHWADAVPELRQLRAMALGELAAQQLEPK